MDKEYQEDKLRQFFMEPSLKSGLYLIDTDLSDEDIEAVMRQAGNSLYEKILVPAVGASTFEMFVAGLSYKCNNPEIDEQREQWLRAIVNGCERDVLLFNLVIRIMRCLCTKERTVLHLQSEKDITSFSHNELSTLQTSLAYHQVTTIIINKEQNGKVLDSDGIINRLSIRENIAYRTMDRLSKVHISYKHDSEHDEAVESIKRGLKKNNIAFSIDADGIKYRDNIVEYEKEIGDSERVIIFVINDYLKSLDCMFEMVQMFKMGNVKERLFPVVDLKGIPRNGDGLKTVKDYWTNEKNRKLEQMKSEGNSDFMQDETRKINDILKYIDEFWDFLVHINTGNYEKMIENDAALLMEELKKTLPKYEASFSSKFVPSGSSEPAPSRTIIQNGANSIYVENHNGPIVLESIMPKRNRFSTEIRYAFDKPYIKVFFYDDSDVTVAKDVVGALNSVMRVNVTESQSAAHPGNTLTVYPKPMVSADECESDVNGALNGYFAQGVIAEKK